MGVSFVHAADLHLGSPLRAVEDADESLAERLSRATHNSFRRIVDLAIDQNIDFVVVSGDLYDRQARSVEANEFLVEQFGRLQEAEIPCYVIHGNHDPLGEGAEKLDLPNNVHVFGADEVGTAYFPDSEDPKARLLGQSYGSRHESGSPYFYYTPEDRAIPNIGLLHTGLNPDGRRYAPCSPTDLAGKDIDYWALGHIHSPKLIDGAPAAYSGTPQGRHIGELNAGGCLLVNLEPGGVPDLEFFPTSPIVWQEISIDIGEATLPDGRPLRNISDAESYIDELAIDLRNQDPEQFVTTTGIPLANKEWKPEGIICRWRLKGRGELNETLDEEATDVLASRLRDRLADGSPFVWTESVRDRTAAPIPDIDTLAERDEIISELRDLVNELREDSDARSEIRRDVGEVWESIDDPDREDTPPDRLPLDPDRLDDLIDRAATRAIDQLAISRNHAN